MREYMRLQLLSWSKFIKINYFSKMLGLNASNVSNFIRFNDRSLSDEKVKLLYDTILDQLRDNFA